MRKHIFAWQAILALLVFSPLALLPAPSRAALLTSRARLAHGDGELLRTRAVDNLAAMGLAPERADEIIKYLSPAEIRQLALLPSGAKAGGQVYEALSTNETVAIVLTLIMLATVVGFVEVTRH